MRSLWPGSDRSESSGRSRLPRQPQTRAGSREDYRQGSLAYNQQSSGRVQTRGEGDRAPLLDGGSGRAQSSSRGVNFAQEASPPGSAYDTYTAPASQENAAMRGFEDDEPPRRPIQQQSLPSRGRGRGAAASPTPMLTRQGTGDTAFDVRYEGGGSIHEDPVRVVSDPYARSQGSAMSAREGGQYGGYDSAQYGGGYQPGGYQGQGQGYASGSYLAQQSGGYQTNGTQYGQQTRYGAAPPPAAARNFSGSLFFLGATRAPAARMGMRDCAVQATQEPRELVELLHDAIAQWSPEEVAIVARRRNVTSRFVDKLKVSCGLGLESEEHQAHKSIHKEIRHLRKRKAAASMLLDQLEKEVVEIEKQLEDRQAYGARLQRSLPPPSITDTCCHAWNDDTEEMNVGTQTAVHQGIVELRPVLRSRLEESELSLHEANQELQKLRYELKGMQEQNKALSGTSLKITQRSSDLRKNLVQRYAASFRQDNANSLRLVFVTWLAILEQRKQAERSAAQGATAFMKGVQRAPDKMAFTFWKQYVTRDVEQRRRREAMKKETVIRNYAAKLLMSSFTAIVQAVLAAWWKESQDAKLRRRLDDAALTTEQKQDQATFKDVVEVHVSMLNAKGLRAADRWTGSSDPYCICEVPGRPGVRCETEIQKNTLQPVWEKAEHDIPDYKEGESLRFTVKDRDRGKADDLLGTALLRAPDFFPGGFHGELLLSEEPGSRAAGSGQLPPKLTVKVDVKVRRVKTARAAAAEQMVSAAPNAGGAAQADVALAAAEAAKAAIAALREDEEKRRGHAAANAGQRPCCALM